MWVDLAPTRGSEADARRPAVLVSNDGANRTAEALGRGVVTVVPVTSNTTRVHPFQVLIPSGAAGLGQDSKAQAEQIRSIEVARLGAVIGRLDPDLADDLDAAIRLHLSL